MSNISNYFPQRKRNLLNEFKNIEMNINENELLNKEKLKVFNENLITDVYWENKRDDKNIIDCKWNKSIDASTESMNVEELANSNCLEKLNCVDELVKNVKQIAFTQNDLVNNDTKIDVNNNNNEKMNKSNDSINYLGDDENDFWDDDDEELNEILRKFPNIFEENSSGFVCMDNDGFVSQGLIKGNVNIPLPKMSSSPIVDKFVIKKSINLSIADPSPVARKRRFGDSMSSNDTFNNSEDDRFIEKFLQENNSNTANTSGNNSSMQIVNDTLEFSSCEIIATQTTKAQAYNSDLDSFEWDEEGDYLCSQF